MSNTMLMKNRPLKNVFKAPVKSEMVDGFNTSFEAINKLEAKAMPKTHTSTESTSVNQVKERKKLTSLDQSRKKEQTKKERSLTDAEYEEIFSSVLSVASDTNPEVEESQFQKQKVNTVKNKHKLPGMSECDGFNIKKQKINTYRKFDLTDDSFQTPVFEDLAIKKKVKKIKKKKSKEPEVQMSQVSTPVEVKTPPKRKKTMPPISPWGSHFAKFSSQGSSFYKPSDESQSIVESLFDDDDDDDSSSSQDEQPSLKSDSKVKMLPNDSDSDKESEEGVIHSRKVKQTTKSGDKEKALHLSKELEKRLEMLHEDRNVGLWVICDNITCQKQRYMPHVTDPLDLPDKWYCSMNPDPLHNSCEKAEHGPEEEEEEYLIHNKYNAGSIVWARVKGYPWWPAMVDDCPDFETYFWLEGTMTPTWYHVVFFDEKVTRAWLKTPAIAPYKGNESAKKCKQTKAYGIDYRARLVTAKKQATDAASLSTYERLKAYSFIARYKKPVGAEIKHVASEKKSSSNITKAKSIKTKARKQDIKGEKNNKLEAITKMQFKAKKIFDKDRYSKVNSSVVHTEETTAQKKLNNILKKNKTKEPKNKNETLHPALGRKSKQTNKKSNNTGHKFNGNAVQEREGIIFSGTILKELLTPKYINKKTEKKKQKEATNKVLENENKILRNESNEIIDKTESKTLKGTEKKDDSDKITQENNNPGSIENVTNENVTNESNVSISNENVNKSNYIYKTENIKIFKDSETNLVQGTALEENNIKQNNNMISGDVIPQSPEFNASGEIQNEEVGSTQETVCENMENENLAGIVTSSGTSFSILNENQDMFSDINMDWCHGDAVVPTLSQSSLPFEYEE